MKDAGTGGWIVAVDGGGSKIAVAAQRAHADLPLPTSLERARSWRFPGTGSAHPSTWPAAQKHLAAALRTVCEELISDGQRLERVVFALAGAGRNEERRRVVDWARQLPELNACAIQCVGDIEPIVDFRRAANSSHAPAIEACASVPAQVMSLAVILGTGSIVAARDDAGQIIRAGGWGPNLGDECSGAALGLAALRAVVAWFDTETSLEAASPLVQCVVGQVVKRMEENPAAGRMAGAADMPQNLDREGLASELITIAADRTTAATFSAPLLELALDHGDDQAQGLVSDQVDRLAQQVQQVVRRASRMRATSAEHPSPAPIGGFLSASTVDFETVFGGGLAEHFPRLPELVAETLSRRGLRPSAIFVADPLVAALRFAVLWHKTR
ncbi:MAG: hypothetical protein ACTHOU_00935 [Aureliella sp.]